MLILLSPAKNMNFDPVVHGLEETTPRLNSDTSELLKRAKKLSRSDLRQLMKISESLADLNFVRFQALSKGLPETEAKPAIHAFNGDVYRGLQAQTLKDDQLNWAQTHLRLLSGLYGVLRPLDKIHPYRLEMSSRLDTKRGENLYDFWGDRISKVLNEDLKIAEGPVLNLASKEYFSAVNKKTLKAPIIEVAFKEEKNGKAKIISFYAKYARGLMTRWIIENKISTPADLRKFDLDGYKFSKDASSERSLVFTRPQPDPKS